MVLEHAVSKVPRIETFEEKKKGQPTTIKVKITHTRNDIGCYENSSGNYVNVITKISRFNVLIMNMIQQVPLHVVTG